MCVRSPRQRSARRAAREIQLAEIIEFVIFPETGAGLARHRGMSVIRTMSLIVGGALVAFGGSALALFM